MRLYLVGAVRPVGIRPRRPVHQQSIFCKRTRTSTLSAERSSPKVIFCGHIPHMIPQPATARKLSIPWGSERRGLTRLGVLAQPNSMPSVFSPRFLKR
jgi:hypothetical protein